MNVRGTSMCLLCAGVLFVACGSKSGKTAEVAGQADTVHVVGSDKDEAWLHCICRIYLERGAERLHPFVGKRSPHERSG